MADEDWGLTVVTLSPQGYTMAIPKKVLADNAFLLNELIPCGLDLYDSPVLKLHLPGVRPRDFRTLADWLQGVPLPQVRESPGAPLIVNGSRLTTAPKEEYPATFYDSLRQTRNRRRQRDNLIQNELLSLAMFAERYGMEEFFNAAISAFRQGERILNRQDTPFGSIGMVYFDSCDQTIIHTRKFVCDHVYFITTVGRTRNTLDHMFEKFPMFRRDFDLRDKAEEVVPGLTRECVDCKTWGRKYTVTMDESKGPIGDVPGKYHIHNGVCYIQRPCPYGCNVRT